MAISTAQARIGNWIILRCSCSIALISLSACVSNQNSQEPPGGNDEGSTIPLLQSASPGKDGESAAKVQQITLPSAGDRLKISTAVETALRENLKTKVFREQENEAAAGVEVERGAFDPELSSDLSSGTNDLSNGGYSYGVNKRFQTGTQVQVEGGTSYDEDLPIADGFPTSDSSTFGLRIRQPLLRGAGVKYNQSGIKRAKLVAVAADIRTQAQIYQTLREVESSYWAAATYQQLVLARMNSVSRNRSLVDDVKARKDLGSATTLDVLEAESSQAEANLELVSARKLYRDEVDRIQVLLGMDLSTGHFDWEMDPVTTAFDRKQSPSEQAIYDNAMENAPEIALLINEVEQRGIEAFRANREKLPRLDLELDSIKRDGSSDSGAPWETIGLVRVSIPWGNRERNALYDQAQSRLAASQLTRADEELKLKQQIFEVTRRIVSGKEELAVAKYALKVNEAKWNEQLARSKEGLVATRALRESELDLREAEVKENTARLKLILAWSYLSQLDGSIADRLGVQLASN